MRPWQARLSQHAFWRNFDMLVVPWMTTNSRTDWA